MDQGVTTCEGFNLDNMYVGTLGLFFESWSAHC